jgi:hypothetical protein
MTSPDLDPDLIYTGQVFQVPANPPASVRAGTYQAPPAAPASSPAPAASNTAASNTAASNIPVSDTAHHAPAAANAVAAACGL